MVFSMEANVISINLWQTHVLSCPTCGIAKDFGGLCQAAQNFWKPPEIPQIPQNPSVSQNPRSSFIPQNQRTEDFCPEGDSQNPRNEAPSYSHEYTADHRSCGENTVDRRSADRRSCGQQSADRRSVALVLDGAGLSSLAAQVSERIMVKTSSGVSIAVYGEMKDVIWRISQITEVMGAHMLFQGEMHNAAPGASRADAATTAIDVRRRTGLPIEPLDQVYGAFGDVASRVLRLGDTMGSLMTVDDETRRVIRSLRMLGIRMRGELERSVQGELVIDESSREVIQEARAVAIDLQGEIERRVGT